MGILLLEAFLITLTLLGPWRIRPFRPAGTACDGRHLPGPTIFLDLLPQPPVAPHNQVSIHISVLQWPYSVIFISLQISCHSTKTSTASGVIFKFIDPFRPNLIRNPRRPPFLPRRPLNSTDRPLLLPMVWIPLAKPPSSLDGPLAWPAFFHYWLPILTSACSISLHSFYHL
jgi:hypothetical protein